MDAYKEDTGKQYCSHSRNVGDSQNSPVFKYADLLNRAIAYKNANPQTNVEVKFAMYTLAWALTSGSIPRIRTTANIDDHDNSGIPSGKDWVQSGILINGHPELMASYNKYFNLIYDNYNNQQNFHSAVRAMHASNSLNYDDEHFSSYFTPLPLSPQGNYVAGKSDKSSVQGNAWDVNFNPVAKYTSQMATQTGNRYLKVNVYHFKMDNFGTTFYNELANIYNSNSSGTKHFRFVVKENTYESTFSLTNLNNIGIVKFPKPTHAKDITFAFSNIGSYYTLTGSTNLKLDDNLSKANSTIVVKEFTSEHPIYNAYKDIYNYQY